MLNNKNATVSQIATVLGRNDTLKTGRLISGLKLSPIKDILVMLQIGWAPCLYSACLSHPWKFGKSPQVREKKDDIFRNFLNPSLLVIGGVLMGGVSGSIGLGWAGFETEISWVVGEDIY